MVTIENLQNAAGILNIRQIAELTCIDSDRLYNCINEGKQLTTEENLKIWITLFIHGIELEGKIWEKRNELFRQAIKELAGNSIDYNTSNSHSEEILNIADKITAMTAQDCKFSWINWNLLKKIRSDISMENLLDNVKTLILGAIVFHTLHKENKTELYQTLSEEIFHW